MADPSSPKSAEEQVLENIDALLAENENALSVPLTKINQATAKVVDNNAKTIKKLTEKILKVADRELVKNENHLDGVTTTILQGIDSYLNDANFILTQMAAKGGLTEIGQPLTTALLSEITDVPELTYAGTLVLAVKEAIPWLDRIASALERIADSVNPSAALKSEREAVAEEAEATDEFEFDTQRKGFTVPLV